MSCSTIKRKLEDENGCDRRVKAIKSLKFKICNDVNELIPEKLISAETNYDNTQVFLITRMRYYNEYLYLFLTGYNNVQFYFRCLCKIYSYKLCFHIRTPCPNRCKPYKSMVVTGLKTRECHRINVYKVDKSKESFTDDRLLDAFCTDENRVQMQLGVYEGDYIKFENGVQVDKYGCAIGSIKSIVKVPLNLLSKPIETIVGCYDLETFTNLKSFSNAQSDPIITISYVLYDHFEKKRYCFINTRGQKYDLSDTDLDEDRNDDNEYWDGEIVVLPYASEKKMIESFFKLLYRSNPDDILDYNGDSFDIPYLMTRASLLQVDTRISRYNLSKQEMNVINVNTKFGYSINNHFMKYFNHLDVYQFIKGSIDAGKIENLKLNTTANFYLKVGKVELSVSEMMKLYNDNKYAKIIKYNVRDSILPIEMYRKCKMANKMYADAALLYMSRDDSTLTIWRKINLALFNRAIINKTEDGQNDAYFFNKYDLSLIMSKKSRNDEENNDDDEDDDKIERGELVDYTNLNRSRVSEDQIPENAIALCNLKSYMKYTGGKVLSPKPGYYKLIFTLDFSQLYTSIMIHFNCCLSNLFFSNNKLYLQRNENAITTKFLKEMADKRALYKNEMKKFSSDSFEYQMYDSWQNAAKLVCNSQYGWFGLCCKPLANFITAQGRIKLTEAQEFIEKLSENENIKQKWNLSVMRLKVVYGDTDSNFVGVDILPDELNKMGGIKEFEKLIRQDILDPLNKIWNGSFKMELENIMEGTLIKGKKMYMCLKSNGSLYKRGLNVKKDTPLFMRESFDRAYMCLLTKHSLECVLKCLVDGLKQKRDEFCVSNCEDYSFSQTLNETKNGTNGSITVAYILYIMLKNDANTKYVPCSGDRIPYLLIDKMESKVRDRAKPTQLINERDVINWSKHLGILCTFFNDLISMLGDDNLFVFAFEEICEYFQRNQRFGIVYPNIKALTSSRIKNIICKEQNVKNKKLMSDEVFNEILKNNDNKYIHTHEFTLTKRAPTYKHKTKRLNTNYDCPVCNGRGVAAVFKTTKLDL
nr:dnapol [Darna trima granulovirus]